MRSDDGSWTDEDAGPVARPYTLTGGRTRPRGERHFDLIDTVAALGRPADEVISPGHARILDLCRHPVTVAELAAAAALPLGVVRVLLADLVHDELLTVTSRAPRGRVTDQQLLRKVLDGLHAL
jgi:Protein of unknown function (DUF742)